MGSSDKKKREKKKDFNKAKLKVGRAKAKANNFTDTSFKSKSIIVNQQTLETDTSDTVAQFKQNLSSAVAAKSDNQRRDALAYIANQLSARPPNNPVGTGGVLTKLLPLLSDGTASVRANLLKVFKALPPSEVKPHVEKILMYVRGGMTHMSNIIRADTLNIMDWLLDVAGEEAVSCPGGWLKTLNSFSSMLGWNPSVSSALSSKGWSSASRATMGGGGSAFPKKGTLDAQARQIQVLARFLEVGFRREAALPHDPMAYWDSIYRMPISTPNAFAHLNLFGTPRDEDSEMYTDRVSRQRVFDDKWRAAITVGMDGARKEGGTVGRAAASLRRVLNDDQDVEMENSDSED